MTLGTVEDNAQGAVVGLDNLAFDEAAWIGDILRWIFFKLSNEV